MTQGTWQHTPPAFVGMSLRRQDGPDKVTGRTRYAGDQVVAGMLYARLVLSPYAHARILHIDTSAAQAMPGVVAVFTSATLGMAQGNPLSRVQSPLAQQESLWCGHPVAVVVGETEALAEDGANAVEVDYEPLMAQCSLGNARLTSCFSLIQSSNGKLHSQFVRVLCFLHCMFSFGKS